MEKIIITATAESIEQVIGQLLEAGVDRIYVGEKDFGLRLPTTFSYERLRTIANHRSETSKGNYCCRLMPTHAKYDGCIKPS